MTKLTLIIILFLSYTLSYSQQDILVFKKGNHTINRFWKGSFIAFQLKNKQWQKGEIMKIQNDSFYIRPMIVHYNLMGTDTVHYGIFGYALSDVFSMPKKGYLIDYVDGHFQISKTGGHVHFYWIKSGWLFRTGAAGYAGLHIINGVIQNDLSFAESKTQLGIAAAVFLGGVFLHKAYKPTLRIGRKYHIEIFSVG